MRIAFYAPLKAPSHPTPSGDRLIARLLIDALRRAGHEVEVAARLRSWDGGGDGVRQRALGAAGERLARRLSVKLRALPAAQRPQCWFTYHVYHKAPDWLGPPVSTALGIPYVVAEASIAPKQATGQWAHGYAAARGAILRADRIVSLNTNDIPCLAAARGGTRGLVHLKPFLETRRFTRTAGTRRAAREQLVARLGFPPNEPWLVVVAMMRAGRKAASYRLLAEALREARARPWRLLVVGDGPARQDIERAFEAALGTARVAFLGRVAGERLPALLAACDLFVWPALREPLGMALLEAHAAGLPVIAGAGGGVSDIVRDEITGRLVPVDHACAFAAAVTALLEAPATRQRMGAQAREITAAEHDIDAAGRTLDALLREVVRRP